MPLAQMEVAEFYHQTVQSLVVHSTYLYFVQEDSVRETYLNVTHLLRVKTHRVMSSNTCVTIAHAWLISRRVRQLQLVTHFLTDAMTDFVSSPRHIAHQSPTQIFSTHVQPRLHSDVLMEHAELFLTTALQFYCVVLDLRH